MFGLLYLAVERQEQVKEMKREHPTLVMMATFLSGQFLIYQVRGERLWLTTNHNWSNLNCRAAVWWSSFQGSSSLSYSPFSTLPSDWEILRTRQVLLFYQLQPVLMSWGGETWHWGPGLTLMVVTPVHCTWPGSAPHSLHICLDNERGGGGKSWQENAHGSYTTRVGRRAWSQIFVIKNCLSCFYHFGSALKGFLTIYGTLDLCRIFDK